MKSYSPILVLLVLLAGVWLLTFRMSEEEKEVPLPTIGVQEGYGSDFHAYSSEYGFSFRYPDFMSVLEDPDLNAVYVYSVSKNGEIASAPIVISVGVNNENLTPEEWLLGASSGYMQNKEMLGEYYITTIDEQMAVYTDGGMWVVVNTPDNKFRLSIAPAPGGALALPYSEMGIIVESLHFP